MEPSKLKQINDSISDKNLSIQRHAELLNSSVNTSNTILSVTETLIKYLNGHISKVELTNQLGSIRTPDAFKVVDAVNSLHETLKTHENTDLTEVTSVMQAILNEAKLIPKELPEPKEMVMTDYTDQLKGLKDAIVAVEKVVKAQKLIAEAPIVNVDAPVINVEKPDLIPLQQGFKDVVSAVKKIVIPEYKTDNKAVEKLLKDSNKLLKGILAKPVSSGGGGGSSWSAINVDGIPMPLNLDADGNLRTISAAPVGGATSAKQDELLTELQKKTEPSDIQNVEMINALRALLQQIAVPSWFDPTTNTLRVGTTAVTVSSGTVTTVGTVTNLTNFGTNAADVMARDISISTWAMNSRSTIT